MALLLVFGVGVVTADAVSVQWASNGEPPDVVGPDDSIPVAVDVTLEEDADVCLMQERSWRSDREIFCHNDVSPGDDNQDIHFRTDPDELGLDPGDEASLYVEVEEQGWFSDDDTTTVETVTVEEIIDAEVTDIEVDRGPHVQGETVEISVTVENTGNADANVFYGFGIHHEDGETVKEREDTIPLDVDQSGTETFSWTVDDDASLGDYWIGMNLWESRDRSEQLDAGRDRDGFEVSAPELRVSPSERDVGEIDRDDPPTVEYEVENTGHGDLDWEIISGTRAVTDVNDDGFVVSYAEPGDFTVDISVLARNEQTLGDGSAEVTYRGVGTVPPEPPEATTIQPGGGTLVVGDEMEFDGLAETGSDGVPEEAGGVSDLDYAWRVAGDVERESSGQTRSDVPEAVDTIQVEFESAGETEIEFSVTDTETGLSDDIDAPATVDVQPFELSGQVTDSEFDDPIRAATVYVNDREVATTDSGGTYSAELTELEAQDRHDIRIEPPAHSDDGFHTHEDTFSTDAREMTIDAELEATAQDVRFEVSDVTSIDGYEPTGDPIRDAKIDVDGTVHETNDEGRVDISLDAGEYQYEVTAPEYESVTGELTVRDGEGLHIEAVQLIREDAGLLEVDVVGEDGNSVSPIDWELYLDDEPVQLDAQGRTVVTEGERTLSVETEEDAYADTQREVTITSGEVTTETIDVSSEISADIELRDHDDGTVEEGEGVEALVDVTNTGNVEHTFFVGFSAIGPEGEAYDNDETTGTAVQLAPDETATETLVWEVEPDLPSGQYDLTVAVWEESDRDALERRVDTERKSEAFSLVEFGRTFEITETFDESAVHERGVGLHHTGRQIQTSSATDQSSVYVSAAAGAGGADAGSYGVAVLGDEWQAPSEGEFTVESRYTIDGSTGQRHSWGQLGLSESGSWGASQSGLMVYDATEDEIVVYETEPIWNAARPTWAQAIAETMITVSSALAGHVGGELGEQLAAEKGISTAGQLGVVIGADLGTEFIDEGTSEYLFDRDVHHEFDGEERILRAEFEAKEGHEYLILHTTRAKVTTIGAGGAAAGSNMTVNTNVESLHVEADELDRDPPAVEIVNAPDEDLSDVSTAEITAEIDGQHAGELEFSYRLVGAQEAETSWGDWKSVPDAGDVSISLAELEPDVQDGSYYLEVRARDRRDDLRSDVVRTEVRTVREAPSIELEAVSDGPAERIEFTTESETPIKQVELEHRGSEEENWQHWQTLTKPENVTFEEDGGAEIRARAIDLTNRSSDWSTARVDDDRGLTVNTSSSQGVSETEFREIADDGDADQDGRTQPPDEQDESGDFDHDEDTSKEDTEQTGSPQSPGGSGDGVDLPDIDVDVDVEALVDELLDLLEDLISVAQPDAQYQP